MLHCFLRAAFQLFRLLRGHQRIDELVQIAIQNGVQLVERQSDAVIRDPALGEVVGADALGAVACFSRSIS